MEFQSIVKILVCIVFLFAISGIPTAFGNVAESRIATSKCTHDQLYTAGGEMLKCESDYIHRYLVTLSEIYENGDFDLQEACKITNEIALDQRKECALNFASSCLPDYIYSFITNLYDALQLDCNQPWLLFNSTSNDQDELQTVFDELYDNMENDPNVGFLSFDKQCTPMERLESLDKVDQCMSPIIYGQSFDATRRTGRYPIWSFNDYGILDDFKPCKTLSKVLDECFKENECFSQREMGMARDLVATIYKTVMEPLTLIANRFGSLIEFVGFVHDEVTMKWNDRMIEVPISAVFDPYIAIAWQVLVLVDHTVSDYNKDDCELNRNK